jgi:hypothetical protein
MTPDRWQQIEKIYHSALELEESQRLAFVEKACAGDEALVFGLSAVISGKYASKYAAVLSPASIRLTPELNYLSKPLGL